MIESTWVGFDKIELNKSILSLLTSGVHSLLLILR